MFEIILLCIAVPALVGVLGRLALRKFSFGFIFTVICAVICAIAVATAINPPVGGNEGYWFMAYMAITLTLSSFVTGLVLYIKNIRRKNNE